MMTTLVKSAGFWLCVFLVLFAAEGVYRGTVEVYRLVLVTGFALAVITMRIETEFALARRTNGSADAIKAIEALAKRVEEVATNAHDIVSGLPERESRPRRPGLHEMLLRIERLEGTTGIGPGRPPQPLE